MNINSFWGDLTDISATKEALIVLAEIPVRSPQKSVISIATNTIHRINIKQSRTSL